MKRLLIGIAAAVALWPASAGAAGLATDPPASASGAGQIGATVNNITSAGPDFFAFHAQSTSNGATGRMYLREGITAQVVADVTCLKTAGSLVRIVGRVTQASGNFEVGSTLVFDASDNDAGTEGLQPPVGDTFIRSRAPGSLLNDLCVAPTDPGLPLFRGDIFVSTAPGASITAPGAGGVAPGSDDK